jgi:TonB family protein
MSDSESDAFSVLGSARFVNGELRVRAGRKVRSRRPKIGLAGQLDAVYSRVEVTLRVATDKTGKVTAVDVAKSSGSNEIDQPCRVSMFDWWFEPKKDAAGNPVADVFNFTIGFQ